MFSMPFYRNEFPFYNHDEFRFYNICIRHTVIVMSSSCKDQGPGSHRKDQALGSHHMDQGLESRQGTPSITPLATLALA
jgi:hypothetical protein